MTQSSLPSPPKHENGPFVFAGVLMLIGMAGVLYWKFSGKPAEISAPATAPLPSVADKAVLEEAPPPPPPMEQASAQPKIEESKAPSTAARGASGNCGPVCDGNVSAALTGALHAVAKQSRACYERALRQNSTLQGRMVVAMRITPAGSVCSTKIVSNTLGDASVASCVSQKFKASLLPKPSGGCVDVEFPIQFKPEGQ